jgi:voltage-gated potassium channel Kch
MPNLLPDDIDPKLLFRFLTVTVLITLGIGTVFYHYVEGFSWVDAYYFSVVTLATVGYGDLAPRTSIGKIFTTIYIFAGVGIIGTYFSLLLRRRAERRIGKLYKNDQDN